MNRVILAILSVLLFATVSFAERIDIPAGTLSYSWEQVKDKDFYVVKKNGTTDSRVRDIAELAADWVYRRNAILKCQQEGDQNCVNRAQLNFQDVNDWLNAYDSSDVSFMIGIAEEHYRRTGIYSF